MEIIKASFEAEAKVYDRNIIQLIPYYTQMVKALCNSIPFRQTDNIRVLDLGCGSGTIAQAIADKFPESEITCVDIASNMLKIARHKLSGHRNTHFIQADFSRDSLPDTYDVIVSSLALHHLESDQAKKMFFQKIYDSLAPRGVFYNADVVLGSSTILQEQYMHAWKTFMLKNVSEEDIENIWLPKYKSEDRPAKLVDQLKWLEAAGFNSIDVIWKYYNFAVYGGEK